MLRKIAYGFLHTHSHSHTHAELLPHMTSSTSEEEGRKGGRQGAARQAARLQRHIIQTDKLDRTQQPVTGTGDPRLLIHCSKIEIDDKKTDEDIAE